MAPIVSIIVPIYNVEQYLKKCLDSLVHQTLNNIEILCVNDGSPDQSQIIVDEYVKNYPTKVKSLIKKNGGLADARNYGLNHAQGEYIAFIDSDDWVEITMLQEMYELAFSNDADIVVCDMQSVYDSGRMQFESGGTFTETNVNINPKIIKINNSACNKLYKRSLFEDVKFPKGLWYEDLGCIPIILAKANKIVKIDKTFYNYFQREGSIMHTQSEKIFDIYKAIDLIYDYVTKHNLPCIKEVKSLYIEHGAKLTTIRIKDYRQQREQFLVQNIRLLQERYPRWIRDSIIKEYSFKEKVVLYLLSIKRYKLVLALYDWK